MRGLGPAVVQRSQIAPIAGSETHEQRPILRTMRRLVGRVLRIGAAEGDTEDERLRKVLLLAATVMVVPAAGVWGAIYWVFGETRAALVPWTYVVIFALSLVVFGLTRRYAWFAIAQFTAFLVLPFVLMWFLGGFVSGSAVALWAWLSPLGARIVGHRRAALLLFVAFAAGFALSPALELSLPQDGQLPDAVVTALFVLNVVAVAAITLTLIDASAGGREGTLASMRGIVRRYFSPDVAAVILANPDRQALGGGLAEVTIPSRTSVGTRRSRAIARPTRSSSCSTRSSALPCRPSSPRAALRCSCRVTRSWPSSGHPGRCPTMPAEPHRPRSSSGMRASRWSAEMRIGHASASASTPGRPSSATSAATSSATSRPSATR